jgi:protein SCO1/2
MNKWIIVFLAVLFVACSNEEKSQIPYYNTPDFTPHFLTATEAEKFIHHRINQFEMSNQLGKKFSDKDLQGKIYVANFIFTKCGKICPEMTAQMKRIDRAFHKNSDVALISFTVTPWLDDVKTLHEFGKKHQISPKNWQLLTGKKEEIYQLARKSFFAEETLGYNKASSEFLHTEHLVLVDQKGRIRGIYNGTLPLDADQCIEDIQEILKEEG